jgi:hypothetical protein
VDMNAKPARARNAAMVRTITTLSQVDMNAGRRRLLT